MTNFLSNFPAAENDPSPLQSEDALSQVVKQDFDPIKKPLPFAISQLSHPVFAGAVLSDPNAPKPIAVRRKFHEAGERHFAIAPRCVANGWSVYPQTRDGRRPALIDGHSVLLKPYRDKLPTQAEVEWWLAKTPTSNTALQLGPASGHTFAIDIDIDGQQDAAWVIKLATRHLGHTPFWRQGRAPRMVLIYRRDPAKPIRSRALKIAGSDDAIEILGDGKSVTIFGAHHRTGDYFKWADAITPANSRPDLAPVVSAEQMEAFLDAVDHWKELQGYRQKPVTHFSAEQVDFDGTVVSPRQKMDTGTWEKAGVGKLLVDGRQAFLFNRALAYVRLNADAVRTDNGSKAVYSRYLAEALRYVARTGRWSTDAAIEAECRSIWPRTRDNLLADRIKSQVVSVREDGTREVAITGGVLAIAGDLGEAADWIAPAGSKARRKSPTRIVVKADEDHKSCPERAKRLALLDSATRIDVGQLVSREVAEAIDSFLAALWDNKKRIVALIEKGTQLPQALREVGALIAPTGAGKTSTLIRRFVAMREARGPLPFALAVFLPGHANANEAKSIALATGAADVWNEALEASRGAKVLQFKGKVLAGCLIADKMKRLQDANIPTSGLCQQTTTDAYGEKIVTDCEFKSSCPAMAQIDLALKADLIFLPHAYLTAPLPKAVKERIGACVIDERFWGEVAKAAIMPIETLARGRKRPFLTKTDKRDGITADDLIYERDQAASIATKAMLAGECPAVALAAYTKTTVLKRRTITGLDLVMSAKTVCSRAQTSSLAVRPGMPDFEIDALIAQPEAESVMLEWRFWTNISERILQIRAGECAADARDHRIKLLKSGDEASIRVSWRGKLNLSDRPAFLLDASADARILSKVYGARPVSVIRVDAPLHLRCVVVADSFADRALLPDADANKAPEDRERAAIKLSKVRNLISRLGGLYASERVLVGSTQPVEKAMKECWASPPNADFGHYGAFRGLDAYKHHAVAISVGRMELPIDILDGLAAAFSYDDASPEADWNACGTGWEGNQRIRAPKGERRLQRRDGAFVTLSDSVFPDGYEWHRAVQAQWREEELRQFAGRLRPVYRTGEAPLWICAATCVPDGIVVDDIVTLDDLIGGDTVHDIARRMRGVIDEKAAHLHDSADMLVKMSLEGMTPRSSAGYATVRVWVDGQVEGKLVRVAAWVPDMWSALEDAQRRLGHDLDRYEVVTAAPQVNALAMVPEPSKFDRMMSKLPNAATATREELLLERADAEAVLRERVSEAPQVSGRRTVVAMILASYPAAAEPEPPPKALAA